MGAPEAGRGIQNRLSLWPAAGKAASAPVCPARDQPRPLLLSGYLDLPAERAAGFSLWGPRVCEDMFISNIKKKKKVARESHQKKKKMERFFTNKKADA